MVLKYQMISKIQVVSLLNLMVFVDENTEPSVGTLHDSCNTPVQNLSHLSVVHLL